MENQGVQQVTEQSVTRYFKHRDEILRYQKQKYRELRERLLKKKKDESKSISKKTNCRLQDR